MLVKEIMLKPITISPDATVMEAIKMMYDKGFGSLIIVDKEGRLDGLITDRGIIYFIAQNKNINLPISKMMTKKIFCVSPKDSINTAADLMREHKIKRVPVVDKGKVVGVISLAVLIDNADALDEPFLF
jgi:CBS domain-containing protein